MNWNTMQQFVRIVAQMLAGGLVSRGMITEDMQTMTIGAVTSAVALIWWIIWARKNPGATPPKV